MAKYETTYQRNMRNEWEGTTFIPLEGKRQLRVRTGKSDRGVVYTTASGVEVTDHGFINAPFSDFSEPCASEKMRCTEKSVRAQHEAVLLGIEERVERAKQFYKVKASA